jgi:hypothetical protein
MDGIRRLPEAIRPLPNTAKGSLSSATRVVNAVRYNSPTSKELQRSPPPFLRDFRYISE